MTSSVGGSETYSSAPSGKSTPTLGSKAPPEAVVPPKFEEEEDDLDAAVSGGTTCRHNGCGVVYESDDRHRKEGGEASECTYHPKPVSTWPSHKLPARPRSFHCLRRHFLSANPPSKAYFP